MKFYDIYFKRFLTLLILSASAVNIGFGQADTGYNPATLGNHKFIQNSKLGPPFTNTFYKTLLGVGQTVSLQIPPVVFNGEPTFQLQGDLVFTSLDIEYQQQIRDWMAFYGEIELIGNTGTKTGALISQGLNLITGP